LLEEELETIRSVDVVDKEDALPLDESELEEDVGEEELVGFGTADVVLGEVGGGRGGIFFQSEDSLDSRTDIQN
jgi:hypothetical protein